MTHGAVAHVGVPARRGEVGRDVDVEAERRGRARRATSSPSRARPRRRGARNDPGRTRTRTSRRPGPRAPGCRRRDDTGTSATIGRAASSANRVERRRAQRQVGVHDDHPRAARGRGTTRRRRSAARVERRRDRRRRRDPRRVAHRAPRRADDTTTTGSAPGGGDDRARPSAARARPARSASSASARRAFPSANARTGSRRPRRARTGTGDHGLRMLPAVDPSTPWRRASFSPGCARGCGGRSRAREHIPARGPVILASNHISYLDPLTLAWLADRAEPPGPVPRQGRAVRQAALGPLLRAAHQIPVRRGTRRRGRLARRGRRRAARGASASPCSPRARSRSTSSRWRQVGHRPPRAGERRAGHAGRAVGDAPHPDQGPQAALAMGRRRRPVVVGEPVADRAPTSTCKRRDRPDHGARSARCVAARARDLPAVARTGRRRWWVRATGDRGAAHAASAPTGDGT